MSQTLIAALQNPALYSHPISGFRVIETHISWVLLTGDYVYKIKKPVNFGFLDFSELAARKHFCEEELRLNQRLTQGLYLEVIPITGSESTPYLGGEGPAIEYALRCREFPQSQLLSELQARGELQAEQIDELAECIASFHLRTPQVPLEHPLGRPEACMAPVRQNFEQIRPLLSDSADLQQLNALEAWAESSFERLLPVFQARKSGGFIRECHGDIHLGNAAIIDGQTLLFDCIEFNEPFRFTDVTADYAFLAMDLEYRGLKNLARRFVSAYLERTGDYQSLQLLNFYKAYRAMVRAKIALFSLAHQSDLAEQAASLAQYRSYASLAESYSGIPGRFLAITLGVSAVGKSQVALRLCEELGAIRLRSDIERKRLFGETANDQHGLYQAGIYNSQASLATYQRLNSLAAEILQAGYPVVLDATFLQGSQRQAACAVAEANAVPFLILDCHAEDALIAQWLAQRQATGRDPSDATLSVIQAQQASREALTDEERAYSRRIHTADPASLKALLTDLKAFLPGI